MPADHAQFSDWLRDRARARDYDIDSPRGGGKKQLAEDSGVSRGQVGRALAGETIPDIGSQRGLAKALRVDLEEMLIRSGLCEPEDFPNYPFGEQTPEPRLHSLDEAADELGITDEERRYVRQVMPQTVEIIRSAMASVGPPPGRDLSQRGAGGHPRQPSRKDTAAGE